MTPAACEARAASTVVGKLRDRHAVRDRFGGMGFGRVVVARERHAVAPGHVDERAPVAVVEAGVARAPLREEGVELGFGLGHLAAVVVAQLLLVAETGARPACGP